MPPKQRVWWERHAVNKLGPRRLDALPRGSLRIWFRGTVVRAGIGAINLHCPLMCAEKRPIKKEQVTPY